MSFVMVLQFSVQHFGQVWLVLNVLYKQKRRPFQCICKKRNACEISINSRPCCLSYSEPYHWAGDGDIMVLRLKGQESSRTVAELAALPYIVHTVWVISPSVCLCSILAESKGYPFIRTHMASLCVSVMCFLSLWSHGNSRMNGLFSTEPLCSLPQKP